MSFDDQVRHIVEKREEDRTSIEWLVYLAYVMGQRDGMVEAKEIVDKMKCRRAEG